MSSRRQARTQGPSAAAARTSWVDSILEEVLTATYWFDPGDAGTPYSTTIRFKGRRTRVNGRPSPRDAFVREETIERVIPGSGPISITTRAGGINRGKWAVTAEPVAKGASPVRPVAASDPSAAARSPWPWARVRPIDGALLKTSVAPLTRVPGVIPGIYTVLVTVGILLGVFVEVALVSATGVDRGTIFLASASAVLAGLVGGKGLYVIQKRGERFEGWCIQGFVMALAVAGAIAVARLELPAGLVLNAAAPALFLGIAVGRPGCFIAGCCAGRPSASWWAIWSSDQRLGTRRVPTQFIEALLGLVIGMTSLVIFENVSTLLPGALLVGAVAAYVLGRQFILPLRFDQRAGYPPGRIVTAVIAAVVLVADIGVHLAGVR